MPANLSYRFLVGSLVALGSIGPGGTEGLFRDVQGASAYATTAPVADQRPTAPTRIHATRFSLPLQFEANQGQTDRQVKFLARGQGYTLFMTETEAVIVVPSSDSSPEHGIDGTTSGTRAPESQHPIAGMMARLTEDNRQTSVVRMRFEGAKAHPEVTGQGKLRGIVNYFIGNDPNKWRTHIPTYQRVHYENLYDGIDLTYYGNQGQLEYDLIVAPGADPGQIKLVFEGADKLSVTENGDLVLAVHDSELRLLKPHVYQVVDNKKIEIAANYIISTPDTNSSPFPDAAPLHPPVAWPAAPNGHPIHTVIPARAGIQTASSPSLPRVVGGDPDLLSPPHRVGGDSSQSDKTDWQLRTSGMTGKQPAMRDKQRMTLSTVGLHLAAYDPTKPLIIDPVLVFSTYLGGGVLDGAMGIAVDGEGAIYGIGTTTSADFPVVSPLPNGVMREGSHDAFVVKIKAAEPQLVYSTYLGGSVIEEGWGIAVDRAGAVYVTGRTTSSDFPVVSPLPGGNMLDGSEDAFVTKLDAAGSAVVYSTYLGGSVSESGRSIAVGQMGAAYVTGLTNSANFPVVNPLPGGNMLGGLQDAFVAKLNTAGSALLYSTYLGGNAREVGEGIAIDLVGAAYVTGSTSSSDFPVLGPLPGGNMLQGTQDAFVAKLNAGGSALVYSTYLGGSDIEGERGAIAVDMAGNAYVTGSTTSSDFPVLGPLPGGNMLKGAQDAFVTKLDASGSAMVYSTYLGGNVSEGGIGVAVDAEGAAYITGFTSSADFPVISPLAEGDRLRGTQDAFVAKLNVAGSALDYSTYLGGSDIDGGEGIAVDTAGVAYVAGGTGSTDFPVVSPLPSGGTPGGGFNDAFVAKICNDPPVGTSPGTWKGTGSFVSGARFQHRAVRLADGKVLIVGGTDAGGTALSTSERYDPTTGTWSSTGSVNTARAFHTATRLADGRVLVYGGDNAGTLLNFGEIYNPGTGLWSVSIDTGVPRERHSATLLPNGQVLLAGGSTNLDFASTSVELFDPATDTFSSTGSLTTGRNFHTATLLADGRVLVVGGVGSGALSLNSAEIYDPHTELWTPAATMQQARQSHAAIRLADGRVLVIGGAFNSGEGGLIPLDSAEIYDPASNTWSTNTPRLQFARTLPGAVLLSDGRVLVVGGRGPSEEGNPFIAAAELYDPQGNAWGLADSLTNARVVFTSHPQLLANGQVLVAGGQGGDPLNPAPLATAELYTPNLCGPEANLALTVTTSPEPVRQETALQVDVQVTNNGTNDAATVRTHTDISTTDFTFDAPSSDPACSETGGVVTCEFDAVANGATPLRTFFLDTTTANPGIKSLATMAELVGEFDPDLGDNAANNTTIVQSANPQTDLALTITDTPDPVLLSSGSYSYTLTINNLGTDVALNVEMTATLPGGVNLASVNPAVGSCSGNTTLTCTLGNLDVGTGVQVVLEVTATQSGVYTLTATATSDPSVPDNDSTNNTDITETTSVGQRVFRVNSASDGPDASVGNGVCETATAGECTLRAAIEEAVHPNNAGLDIITFNIGTGGLQTIRVGGTIGPAQGFGFPAIVDPVVIDGTSQPGFSGVPIIELDGTNAGSRTNGLLIQAGGTTVRGLIINRFGGDGIRIEPASGNPANSADGNHIVGNYVGTDPTGLIDLGNSSDGIQLIGSSSNMIGGLTAADRNVISGNAGDGVDVQGPSSGNVVIGNYIGVDATGNGALGNDTAGVFITASAGNTIGGSSAAARNIISGNASNGVFLNQPGTIGNSVQGNWIGLNVSGAPLGNNGTAGVLVSNGANNNLIGGVSPGAGNVISGNLVHGVVIQTSSMGNEVQGNYIGTDPTGLDQRPNMAIGIVIDDASNNCIGGSRPGTLGNPCLAPFKGNVISGNGTEGITIRAGSGNSIQANLIGTDVNGTSALGNGLNGVKFVGGSTGNIIGGTVPSSRNIISGNGQHGVFLLDATTSGNLIQGNYIGTSADGGTALPNASMGVALDLGAQNNTIGGTVAGAGNVLSGNGDHGLIISGAGTNANLVQGNVIGLNATQTAPLPNFCEGMSITQSASGNLIGGSDTGARNLIMGNNQAGIVIINGASGNTVQGNVISDNGQNMLSCPGPSGHGIAIAFGDLGPSPMSNVVIGNLIGTDPTGALAKPNAQHGVAISGASNNSIGGLTPGAGNIIAFNGGHGVVLDGGSSAAGTGNAIQQNSILQNTALGIDLGDDGVTPNDALDVDGSPNNLQNFPVLTSAMSDGGFTTITGSLNSTPGMTFRVEFFSNIACDASGNGEGETFIGSTSVLTNGNGDVPIGVSFGATVPVGQFITATATDLGGNTSEFSQCVAVTAAGTNNPPTITSAAVTTATEGVQYTYNVDATDPDPGDLLTFTLDIGPEGMTIAPDTGVILWTPTDAQAQASPQTVTARVSDRVISVADEVLVNGGFETAEVTNIPTVGIPNTVGDWEGDDTAIVSAQNGITPIEGTQMLQFLATLPSGPDAVTGGSEILQIIDLTPFAAQVLTGQMIATVSGQFNRVAGDTETDTQFASSVFVFDGDPSNLPAFLLANGGLNEAPNLGSASGAVLTDGDPTTWQVASASIHIPPNATFLLVRYFAAENVHNDAVAPEFDGHYGDAFRVSLNTVGGMSAIQTFSITVQNAITVNSTDDPGDGTCDATECTLREAITLSNNTPGIDTIIFNIDNTTFPLQNGSHTIQPDGVGLPTISDPVIIDGTTEPDFDGTPVIELDGTNAGPGANGLFITAGDSVVQGLVLNRFTDFGLKLAIGGSNVVRGNYVGTDVTGTLPHPNGQSGIFIGDGTSLNVIGGTSGVSVNGPCTGDCNLISGNTNAGIQFGTNATNNIIIGNYIGTKVNGAEQLGNGGNGIFVGSGSNDNRIGGVTPQERNVISGNSIGVTLSAVSNTLIRGNYVGTDISGNFSLSNASFGVSIVNSPNNIIGGLDPGARNVISGNASTGVTISLSGSTGNVVQGNFIGTNAAGTGPLGNGVHGVSVNSAATGNVIGGVTTGAGNVISGNTLVGVSITNAAAGNFVQGNFIGTNAAGSGPVANGTNGVGIDTGAANNLIGGTVGNARNVISGNLSNGIEIKEAGSTGNLIQGNYIGVGANGLAPLGNGHVGVLVDGGTGNTIGGSVAGASNVISANAAHGVQIINGSNPGNTVQGNLIGTDATGTLDRGNARHGVLVLDASSQSIVGNTVSGNDEVGIQISGGGSINNVVGANRIGIASIGTGRLGNTQSGVRLADSASGNRIGGATPGAGNVIAANGLHGVLITNGAFGNVIEGNTIGTDTNFTLGLGNVGDGVRILTGLAANNRVGGANAGSGNVIAFNGGNGVVLNGGLNAAGAGNLIQANRIFENAALGIDLGDDGVTPNDQGDADNGPNNLQNFPDLTIAFSTETATTIEGKLESTAGTTLTLDFYTVGACDASGHGEGRTLVHSQAVTTDDATTATPGQAEFTVNIAPRLEIGVGLTATATDPQGNTSEFSNCVLVETPSFPLTVDIGGPGIGTVVRTAVGEACGENCERYPLNTPVTLVAEPDDGFFFVRWEGEGCQGIDPECDLSMDKARTVEAVFCPITGGCAPSPPPTALSCQALWLGGTISCAWELPPLAQGLTLDGINFYIGTEPGIFPDTFNGQPNPTFLPGPVILHTVTGLTPGVTYFITVTTVSSLAGSPLTQGLQAEKLTASAQTTIESPRALGTQITIPTDLESAWEPISDENTTGLTLWGCKTPPASENDPCGELAQQGDRGPDPNVPIDPIAQLGTYLQHREGVIHGLTDYVMGFNLQSDVDGAVGIMFRMIDAHHYYRFSWDRLGQYRRLIKRDGDTFTVLCEHDFINQTRTPLNGCGSGDKPTFSEGEEPYEPGVNYTISVNLTGDTLRVSILDPRNGSNPVDWEVTDPNSFQGIGYAYYSSNNPGTTVQEAMRPGVLDPTSVTQRSLEVRPRGQGRGMVQTIAADGTPVNQIACTPDCVETFPPQTPMVRLEARPLNADFIFAGWTAAQDDQCQGNAGLSTDTPVMAVTLDVPLVDGTTCAIATFDGVPPPPITLDIDGDGVLTAEKDGAIILRYLFGLRGPALTQGLVPQGALDSAAPEAITQRLDVARGSMLDPDGNRQASATTDGLVIQRFLAGVRGEALLSGVVDPQGARIKSAVLGPPERVTKIVEYLCVFVPDSLIASVPGCSPPASGGSTSALGSVVQAQSSGITGLASPQSLTQPLPQIEGEASLGQSSTAPASPSLATPNIGESLPASETLNPVQENTQALNPSRAGPISQSGTPPNSGHDSSPLGTDSGSPTPGLSPTEPEFSSSHHSSESPSHPGLEPVVLSASWDSIVVARSPNRNYGAHSQLRVGRKPRQHALLGFKIPRTLEQTPTRAYIVLSLRQSAKSTIARDGTSLPELTLHPLTREFAEGNGRGKQSKKSRGNGLGVTWNCPTDRNIRNRKRDCEELWKGGLGGLAEAGKESTHGTWDLEDGEWVADVTEAVQAALAKGIHSLFWVVTPSGDGHGKPVHFFSREGAAKVQGRVVAPRLVLHFDEKVQ